MKYLSSIFFILLFSMSFLQAQEKNIMVDKIIAKVGGEIILYSEIEEQYAYMTSQQGIDDADKCQILKNIIAQNLLVNQAKIDSLVVSDQEVTAQLDARINRILQLMNNDVSQFESYYGKTVEQVKREMRDDIRNQLLSQRMRSEINSDVEASPKETISFYKNMHPDSIPYYSSEVQLKELVFKPIISEVEEEKAINKLQDIRQRILDGEISFSDAAATYSEDPGSARNGGSLGMKKRGSLAREYEATAYNLEKGEVSRVVETEFGFHIIKLIERRGNNIKTKHILIKPELTEGDLQYSREKLDSIKHLVIADSLDFESAVKEYGYEKVQSYNNGGGMLNQQSGDTYFEVGELEPDVYFAIDTLDVGEIAGPIQYRKRDGTVMLRLVQLESITEPHRANLKEDYAKIKQMATEEKKFRSFQQWIDEKIQSTYISIEPPFDKCEKINKWIKGKKASITVKPNKTRSQQQQQ